MNDIIGLGCHLAMIEPDKPEEFYLFKLINVATEPAITSNVDLTIDSDTEAADDNKETLHRRLKIKQEKTADPAYLENLYRMKHDPDEIPEYEPMEPEEPIDNVVPEPEVTAQPIAEHYAATSG